MKKSYCIQNDGKCGTCSLVNYGMDCQNYPIHGGKRPGSGRPTTGRKKHQYYISDSEAGQVKRLIDYLRSNERS